MDGTADYTYDATNQLTDADYTCQADEDYDYDANGNRTNNGYTVGPNNHLLSDGTYRYLYDAEGNRTARFVDADQSGTVSAGDTDITEYAWDHRNRLVEVTHYANYAGYSGEEPDKVVQYAYDFGNRWVRKVLDADGDGDADEGTIFVYDANQIALEFDDVTPSDPAAASDLGHRYLWGTAVDQVLADETVDDGGSEDVLWPFGDHLGTVRDLASYDAENDITTIANHRVFNAFGERTSQTNPQVVHLFGFTGRPLDEDTGLQNNLNRWYDAGVGKWLSEDPIGFAASDENLCRYCANSPAIDVDPTGLWTTPQRHNHDEWAPTCAQRGDTWESLAEVTDLDPAEYREWVWEGSLPPTPVVGKKYHVPNVIVAYYARLSATDISAATTICQTQAGQTIHVYEHDGYKVERVYTGTVASFQESFAREDACGFVFAGHGQTGNGEVWGLKLDSTWTGWWNNHAEFVSPRDVERPFQLAYLDLYACYSADPCNGQYWSRFVSPTGEFIGAKGQIGIAPWSTHEWSVWHGPTPPSINP